MQKNAKKPKKLLMETSSMRKPLPLPLQQEMLWDELNTPLRSPAQWFQLLELEYKWTWEDFQLYFTGEIYPNTYARFASYLSRYLKDGEFERYYRSEDEFGIEKYLREFLGSLIVSCIRLSTWEISTPYSEKTPVEFCSTFTRVLARFPNYFYGLFNGSPNFFIEALELVMPTGGIWKSLVYLSAKKKVYNPHLLVAKKALIITHANKLLKAMGADERYQRPSTASIRFLRKLYQLFKELEHFGVPESIFEDTFINENDEEYLQEVLDNKYYYFWPHIFGKATATYGHITSFFSKDTKTLELLGAIRESRPRSPHEIYWRVIHTLVGYPVEVQAFKEIPEVWRYSLGYYTSHGGVPLVLLCVHMGLQLPKESLVDDYGLSLIRKKFTQVYKAWRGTQLDFCSLVVMITCKKESSSLYYIIQYLIQIDKIEAKGAPSLRVVENLQFEIHQYVGYSGNGLIDPRKLNYKIQELKGYLTSLTPCPLSVHRGAVGVWMVSLRKANTGRVSIRPLENYEETQTLVSLDPTLRKLVAKKYLEFTFVTTAAYPKFITEYKTNMLLSFPIFKSPFGVFYAPGFYNERLITLLPKFLIVYPPSKCIFGMENSINAESREFYALMGAEIVEYSKAEEYKEYKVLPIEFSEYQGITSTYFLKCLEEWNRVLPQFKLPIDKGVFSLLLALRKIYPKLTLTQYHEGVLYFLKDTTASLTGHTFYDFVTFAVYNKDIPSFLNLFYPHKKVQGLFVRHLAPRGKAYYRHTGDTEKITVLEYLRNVPVDEANKFVELCNTLESKWGVKSFELLNAYLPEAISRGPSKIYGEIQLLHERYDIPLETLPEVVAFVYTKVKERFPQDAEVLDIIRKFNYLNTKKIANFWGVLFKITPQGVLEVGGGENPRRIQNNLHDFIYSFYIFLNQSPWARCFAPVYLWRKYVPNILQFPQHPEDYRYRDNWCFISNSNYFKKVFTKQSAFFLRDNDTNNPTLIETSTTDLGVTECQTWEGDYSLGDNQKIIDSARKWIQSEHYGVGLAPHYLFLLLTFGFKTRILSPEEDQEVKDVMVDFSTKSLQWSLTKANFQLTYLQDIEFEENIKDNILYVVTSKDSIAFYSWTGKGLEVTMSGIKPKTLPKFVGGSWKKQSFS